MGLKKHILEYVPNLKKNGERGGHGEQSRFLVRGRDGWHRSLKSRARRRRVKK